MRNPIVLIVLAACAVPMVLGQEAISEDPSKSQLIETSEADWTPIAYLEFSPGSKQFKSDLEGFSPATTTETSSESKEKLRVETLKTRDPATGKEIVETETTRSGTSSKTVRNLDKTSLLTIVMRAHEDNAKQETEYRLQIDGVEIFTIPEREIKEARKLAKEYLKAVEKVSKGVPGKPYVNLVFGNKERGAAISGRFDSRTPQLVLRIWVKGRSYDLKPVPGAFGFISDLANIKTP